MLTRQEADYEIATARQLERGRICQHAEDLIKDWQAGNIDTKDMARRLTLFVEKIRA